MDVARHHILWLHTHVILTLRCLLAVVRILFPLAVLLRPASRVTSLYDEEKKPHPIEIAICTSSPAGKLTLEGCLASSRCADGCLLRGIANKAVPSKALSKAHDGATQFYRLALFITSNLRVLWPGT